MKRIVLLLLCEVLLGIAKAEDEPRAINYGGGVAFDLVHATHDHDWLVNLDAGAWVEADLGELVGADDWYLFVNPTLVWGAEENWQWTPRWYQVWLKWDAHDEFNALVGLVDLSWHFHSLPSASPFVRMPARAAGEFSPGSIGLLDLFPLSAPTARIEWKPRDHVYLQAAASWLDDDHQIKGRELFIEHDASNHLIAIAELGYQDEGDEASGWRHRMAGIGGWWLPGADDSWGAYAFADVKLWCERDPNWQGISGFVSGSIARAAGYDTEQRIVAGLSYEGLLPARDEDVTAMAMIWQHDGDRIVHANRTALELLHRVKLDEHSWVQASVQWQSNVDGTGDDEWRAGVRVGWEF